MYGMPNIYPGFLLDTEGGGWLAYWHCSRSMFLQGGFSVLIKENKLRLVTPAESCSFLFRALQYPMTAMTNPRTFFGRTNEVEAQKLCQSNFIPAFIDSASLHYHSYQIFPVVKKTQSSMPLIFTKFTYNLHNSGKNKYFIRYIKWLIF